MRPGRRKVAVCSEKRCRNDNVGAPGRIRTFDLALRRRALYPLSYEGNG
jgi:hypothetical protein